MQPYRGRFAPSPSGPLHAGSLAAALASWLDARAHGGTWLVRIEDLDPPREVPGAAAYIIETLAVFGMTSDEPVQFQSVNGARYAAALDALTRRGVIYGCACSRKDIETAIGRGGGTTGVYPGTCRARGINVSDHGIALRIRVPDEIVAFVDRAAGPYQQSLARDVGDFVLRRADGLWAYQLAVVVDDHAQAISAVVRGADLLDNTPRQTYLQRLLGYATPTYLHVPIVTTAAGEKLSKQTGARALDRTRVLHELEQAWRHLGFSPIGAASVHAFQARAVALWRERWAAPSTIGAAVRSKSRS